MIDSAGDLLRARRERPLRAGEFYALEDVHLELRSGEALAVIGANGAGKSTLLKALAGMLTPSAGRISRNGRIEPVIDLGFGLNAFLTGRENARRDATLKGMAEGESREFVEAVAGFADLGDGLDQPVSSYSSGMAARLSFALAAMARPDVLLVDEALAVGDLAFQRQCTRFIENFLAGGGSLLLVSHNPVQVQNLCSRALLLDRGRPVFAGTAVEAVRAMVQRTRTARCGPDEDAALKLERFGPIGGTALSGQSTDLIVRYRIDEAITDVTWGFEIWSADGQICVTSAQDMTPRTLQSGSGTLACVIDRLPLAPGPYALKLNIVDRVSGTPVMLAGFGGPATYIEVGSPASITSNYQIENGQIAVIDVSWPSADETAARPAAGMRA